MGKRLEQARRAVGKDTDRRLEEIKKLASRIEEIEQSEEEAKKRDELITLLASYTGPDEVVPITEVAEEEIQGIPSGWRSIDRLIPGFLPQQLIVVSGPTGQGKTLFAQNLIKNLTDASHPCALLSYEMSPTEILWRFKEMGDVPMFYIPKTHRQYDMVWLETKVVEAIAKYDVEFVFIDHAHYIVDFGDADNLSAKIGEAVRALKLIARKYDVGIFLLHHTTKTDTFEAPTLADIRDSSFSAQEADYVFMLWRVVEKQGKREIMEEGVKYSNMTKVQVAKNRLTGKLGAVTLMFDNFRLYDLHPEN